MNVENCKLSQQIRKMLLPFPFNIPLFIVFTFLKYFLNFVSYLIGNSPLQQVIGLPATIIGTLSADEK